MKILALNYRDRLHPSAGGAEKHFHEIFSRIALNGHMVVLLSTSFPGARPREMVDGILVVRAGNDLLFQWTVRNTLPKLDEEFDFDIIYEDLNKLPLFSPLLSRKPHLIQIHHLWGKSIFFETNFLTAFGVWAFERSIPLFYRQSNFVSVSESTAKELSSLGISRKRISIIHNGADGNSLKTALKTTLKTAPENISEQQLETRAEPCLETRAESHLQPRLEPRADSLLQPRLEPRADSLLQPRADKNREPYFLWLSRLHRYKGILVALKAFQIFAREIPNGRLKIAGAGPMEKKLPGILKKLGLTERVDIEGFVSGERKKELLRNSLALLQTSRKEGWGLTVIEAAELKTATIASDVPGLCDSVQNGETGVLFPAGDAFSCAKWMIRFYSEPAFRETLETNAEAFSRNFSWDKASRETFSLLQKIAQEKA